MKGRGRRGHTSAFGRRWACPESARDDYARVISDRKWPLKKRPVIAHIKARSKHSFLTINRNDLKKKKKKKKSLLGLIKHVGVFLALCGVCACALMQVLLLPIGRGFTGQCLDIGAWDLASAIGGRVPEAVVTFEPREEALGAWQEVKGEAMSVNEALYGGSLVPRLPLSFSHFFSRANITREKSKERESLVRNRAHPWPP